MVDRQFESLERPAQPGIGGRSTINELGEAGTKQSGVGAGEEERGPEAELGDAVAVTAGDPFDEPVEPEPAEFVAESALSELSGPSPGSPSPA